MRPHGWSKGRLFSAMSGRDSSFVTDFAHIARMESVKQDIELLRRKAAGCERVARKATDVNFRRQNAKRAKLYRDSIEETELSLRRGQTLRLRRASWFGDRRKKPPGL